MQDKEIKQNYAYRGIYDYFAKERFNSEAVVLLNNDELYTNKTFDTENFCRNIVEFSTQLYIHSFDINTEVDLAKQIQLEMQKYYNYITIIEQNNHLILIAKDKKQPLTDYSNLKQYTNNNRGEESKSQSIEIIEILKNATRL